MPKPRHLLRRSRPVRTYTRWWGFALVLVLLVLVLLLVRTYRHWQAARLPFARQTVRLDHVTDGDTVHLIDARGRKVKLRLAGIDAPELGSAASFRAALYLAQELEAAGRIYLEVEPQRPTDKYGRTLGWLFTVRGGRETLLQEELLRQGLAELYPAAQGGKYYSRLEHAKPR